LGYDRVSAGSLGSFRLRHRRLFSKRCLFKVGLRDLRVFVAVVEEGGILKASRKLHRVPSNISTRIKQLEGSMNSQLFYRHKQRLHLSPSGELLLPYAVKLLRLAEEATCAPVGTVPSGMLRLGALERTSASRLPGAWAE